MNENPIGKGATHSGESDNIDVNKGTMLITESIKKTLASDLIIEGMGTSPC